MNILVIKQTSLGDVLNATGHLRALKQQYPDATLTLLTDIRSQPIFRHNTWVDEIILIDRYDIKRNWWRHPLRVAREILRVRKEVRRREYELAFDLQGLAKSVLFLYWARARKKFVKGNWWGIQGLRDKKLHALAEMDQVLSLAGVDTGNTEMVLTAGESEKRSVDQRLDDINPASRPLIVISAFSRWVSKDWPLANYRAVIQAFQDRYLILMTGTGDRQQEIDRMLKGGTGLSAVNLAGSLSLLEFVELVSRAELVLTGDSFPMHVSAALKTPVAAIFGPTDENRVGPGGVRNCIIRVENCDICHHKRCPRKCLERLPPEQVILALQRHLQRPALHSVTQDDHASAQKNGP